MSERGGKDKINRKSPTNLIRFLIFILNLCCEQLHRLQQTVTHKQLALAKRKKVFHHKNPQHVLAVQKKKSLFMTVYARREFKGSA